MGKTKGTFLGLGTIALAIFTWRLVVSTNRLWMEATAASKIAEKAADAANSNAEAAKIQTETFMSSERAYIKMTPVSPGLAIDPASKKIALKMRAKNFGHTPASITAIWISPEYLPAGVLLPKIPDYPISGNAAVSAFLMGGDNIIPEYSWPLDEQVATVVQIQSGAIKLYVYGYVDFIDKFHKRHRTGFARFYTPNSIDNNLAYVTQPGYNYDRPRTKGEGYDWDDNAPS